MYDIYVLDYIYITFLRSKQAQTTKPAQFDILVTFMENHSNLAQGYLKAADARQSAKILWDRLTLELNAVGPPVKEATAWKKVNNIYTNRLL